MNSKWSVTIAFLLACNTSKEDVIENTEDIQTTEDTAFAEDNPSAEDTSYEDTSSEEPETNIANLRIHVISSQLEYLDAASIYTEATIEQYITDSNQVFLPTGITWEIESFVVEPALNEAIVIQSVNTGMPAPGTAMGRTVDHSLMLAPTGYDAYVLQKNAQFDNGGMYKCSLDNGSVPGAVFVPLLASNGTPQAMRKWAHELGHMMNLPHTECSQEFADNLMMSGGCGFAEIDRIHLTDDQIASIQAQFAIGGPAECNE